MNISRRYNLVEVILALGVVAIGVVSIMALFPIGANASRDASMETYAANVADEMLQFIKYRLKEVGDDDKQVAIDNRWNVMIGNADNAGAIKQKASDDDLEDALTFNSPDKLDDTNEWKWTDENSDIFGTVFKKSHTIYPHTSRDQVFQLIGHRNSQNVELGDSDASNSEKDFASNVDFRALAYIWKEQIVIDQTQADDSKVPYTIGVRIIVRVTWPAEIPYDSRQKADYVLEVFKPIIEE